MKEEDESLVKNLLFLCNSKRKNGIKVTSKENDKDNKNEEEKVLHTVSEPNSKYKII